MHGVGRYRYSWTILIYIVAYMKLVYKCKGIRYHLYKLCRGLRRLPCSDNWVL